MSSAIAACTICGSAQTAERCPGVALVFAVSCLTCGKQYLANNPAVAFIDVNVPQEPQMRVRPWHG